MLKKFTSHIIVLLAVAVMLGGIGTPGYAQSPAADVFGVVTISNPQELIPSIGQFIDQFQPGMGGMVNPMMVGNMVFKNPNWTGMDMAGEYKIVVLNPMKYAQAPFAVVVPLTNQDEYLGAISQSLTAGEEADGIYTFMQPNQKNLFMGFAGGQGIMSENTDVASQVKALVEAESPVLAQTPAVKGQIAAFIDLDKILTAVRPMIDMFKQQFLTELESEMPQEGEGEAPAAMKNMLQAEIEMTLALIDQIQKLQLGVSLEPEGLRLSKAVFAMSGSPMEAFMAAQTPQAPPMLGLIPADSGMIMTGTMELTEAFIEGYPSFMESMAGVAKDPETAQQVTSWAQQAFELFDGDFAFGALSSTGQTLITEVFTISDTAKAKQLFEQYPQMFQLMTGMYEELGLDMSMTLTDTVEVSGGEILNYAFDMDFAEMIPDPEGQEVFQSIFGDQVSLPVGFIDNYSVIAIGGDARAQVEAMMAAIESGETGAAEHTPAMFGLPEENNMFMYISIPNMLGWAVQYIPEAPPFDLEMLQQDSPGFGMAGRFIESHFEGELYLPIQEMLTIKTIVEQAQAPSQPSMQ
ncbi:DUF3352 domain-containing protein [candidate division KSB3 bacterium]|uniref:DUF3352 domain-containing protein n=1 Tax=candidate division KSB3 bacterium TaxID=2044937 RepID=A0A9D5JSF1_9BACT|nr:DUF3352 domain-containing protein [candidate division KSB3 bacterium]MBD3323152.1 DUF3352 domain-containing protein [candidate division KSB3 bacterium]